MTDVAMNNALLLAVAIIVASMLVGRLFSRSGKDNNTDRLRPFGNAGSNDAAVASMTREEIELLLARRYRIKFLFRLGVFVCSLAACGAYVLLQNRVLALILVFCAGICQYVIYKHKTNDYLTRALAQQGGMPEGMEHGSQDGSVKRV